MYITRPLSSYKKSPALLSLPPPEGPNSGILVIQDDACKNTTFFGLFKDREITDFPIPQNKAITISYATGLDDHTLYNHVMPIPVLNKPLSSNLFYLTETHGNHSGEAFTCSKEGDAKRARFFGTSTQDVKPRPLDHHDIYQQFHIIQRELFWGSSNGFYAKSVASDGIPPHFLRRKGWRVSTKTPKHYALTEALGLDTVLRAHLPHFNFPLSHESSEPVVVGKWYCPFIFIKDGELKNQSKKSPYYEMTLEQKWEQIFTCENNYNKGNTVTVDIAVKPQVILISGIEDLSGEQIMVNGVIWFKGNETSVGLNMAIVERMKWEQERVGWFHRNGKQTTVNRTEEYKGEGEWKKYGCYVLVERFVLKRADQIVVLTLDYKHTHQINGKWE